MEEGEEEEGCDEGESRLSNGRFESLHRRMQADRQEDRCRDRQVFFTDTPVLRRMILQSVSQSVQSKRERKKQI